MQVISQCSGSLHQYYCWVWHIVNVHPSTVRSMMLCVGRCWVGLRTHCRLASLRCIHYLCQAVLVQGLMARRKAKRGRTSYSPAFCHKFYAISQHTGSATVAVVTAKPDQGACYISIMNLRFHYAVNALLYRILGRWYPLVAFLMFCHRRQQKHY